MISYLFKRVMVVLAAVAAGAAILSAPAQGTDQARTAIMTQAREWTAPETVSLAELQASAGLAAAAPICPVNSSCLWRDINYAGGKKVFYQRRVYSLVPDGWNDKASTICNNWGQVMTFYQHQGYAGYWWTLGPGRCFADLTRITMGGVGTWNDQITSIDVAQY